MSQLVTGTVVALRGTLNEEGTLVVADMCSAGLPPQRKLPLQPGMCAWAHARTHTYEGAAEGVSRTCWVGCLPPRAAAPGHMLAQSQVLSRCVCVCVHVVRGMWSEACGQRMLHTSETKLGCEERSLGVVCRWGGTRERRPAAAGLGPLARGPECRPLGHRPARRLHHRQPWRVSSPRLSPLVYAAHRMATAVMRPRLPRGSSARDLKRACLACHATQMRWLVSGTLSLVVRVCEEVGAM